MKSLFLVILHALKSVFSDVISMLIVYMAYHFPRVQLNLFVLLYFKYSFVDIIWLSLLFFYLI